MIVSQIPPALFGMAAGILTSVSLLPQLIKIIRCKRSDEISLGMFFILLTGLVLWIYYGWLKQDFPLVITNTFSLLITLLIIGFTIRYKIKK
jgi:MtN3 and saliva related transmembrane protein